MADKIPRYIEVAVPLPLRTCLTYRLPARLGGCGEPGARALVPVGRRLVSGVIVGRSEAPRVDPRKIRDVVDLPDAAPLLPADLLRLALWAARYYVAPTGIMIAAALPPGIGRRSDLMVSRAVAPGAAPPGLTAAQRRALEAIPAGRAVRADGLRIAPALLKRLEQAGLVRSSVELRRARVGPRYMRVLHPAGADLAASLALCGRAPRQRQVLELLAGRAGEGVRLEEMRDRLGRVG
ncbi:MAG: hypothetical protein ACE5JG_12850, partial [Planctomycetota bacterium]